jgi:hypothetical protein
LAGDSESTFSVHFVILVIAFVEVTSRIDATSLTVEVAVAPVPLLDLTF